MLHWPQPSLNGIQPMIDVHLDYVESELAQRPWFAGEEFTAADVQMSFPIEAFAARCGLGGSHARLSDWLARIHARPAYQRALERGGPYELMR
jgi:glutathione S-transferase